MLDAADKDFLEHMESLTPREQEMLDGVELGGVKMELVEPQPDPSPESSEYEEYDRT